MEIDSSGARLTFGGLASGLDTGAIIEALLDVERQPLLRLEARRDDLEERRSLVRDLNSKLLALRDAARAVDNQTDTLAAPSSTEEFLEYEASSSDENVLTVSASPDAVPGTYEVRVDRLASVGRRVSEGFASPDDTVSNKNRNFSIDYGGADTIDISIVKNSTTLQQMADEINSHANNDGSVQADVLFDGSEYRLVISGSETGAANDVVVSTNLNNFIDDALTQNAEDASLVAFGVPITRPSNSIDDVIPGVTFQLKGVNDPSQPSAVTAIVVARNDTAVVDKLQALVDAYNALRTLSIQQSSFDEASGRAGSLSGDPTLRSVERSVQNALGSAYSFADNPFSSLSDLGLSFDRDGRLSLDQTRLSAALDQDSGAARQLLAGDGVNDGIATALGRALEPIVRTGDGTLAVRDEGFDERIRSIDVQIERFEARLVIREDTLLQRFAALERLVAAFQGAAGFLQGLQGPTR